MDEATVFLDAQAFLPAFLPEYRSSRSGGRGNSLAAAAAERHAPSGSWSAATGGGVRPAPNDPIAALQRIPQATIARMQRVIAEHAHCIHYRLPLVHGSSADKGSTTQEPNYDGTVSAVPDAFDITLMASFRNSMSHLLKERGSAAGASTAVFGGLCGPVPL